MPRLSRLIRKLTFCILNNMPFDFNLFLEQLDPQSSYRITELTGGIVNWTVRATKQSDQDIDIGRFAGHVSVVCKHAPPYVAGVGPEAILTQSRQVNEATTLSFFDGPLQYVKDRANVMVPHLLHHDPVQHVIMMSDLGQLPNLSDVFYDLGGYIPSNAPKPTADNKDANSRKAPTPFRRSYFNTTGIRIGTFFAHLHSRETLHIALSSATTIDRTLSNSDLLKSVHEYAIKPLESRFQSFVDLTPVDETASTLYRRIEEDWLRPLPDDQRSFVLGDCWTGAVLLSPPPLEVLSGHFQDPDVCVIDWEFATIGRGPHGDLPQFLAHLELFRHAALWCKSLNYIDELDLLMSSLITSYKAVAKSHGEIWLCPSDATDDTKLRHAPDADSVRARVIRSALLGYASEMLNCAFWKVWPCLDRTCPALVSNSSDADTTTSPTSEARQTPPQKKRRPSFQTYSTPPPLRPNPDKKDDQDLVDCSQRYLHDEERLHLCPLIRMMVGTATWLTMRAGKHTAEMCEATNWKILIQGLPALVLHDSTECNATSNEEPHGTQPAPEMANEQVKKRLWLLNVFV